MKRELKSRGFTLIEILAVLILLAVMAALAVPRYFDMMETSEEKALQGALVMMQSRANRAYSESIIRNNGAAATADLDTFGDIYMGSDEEIETSLRHFIGTWRYVDGTTIDYIFKHGNKRYTFHFTGGTTDSPPEIDMIPS